jgi:hypothetical protein
MGSSDKPMDEQLQELWEEQGEKIGVPQGVRDLLNSAPTHKSVRETTPPPPQDARRHTKTYAYIDCATW